MSLNNVVLMGRLTHAPELKYTQSNIAYCHFSIAVDRQYKSGEEKQVDFIDCTAWRTTAEFITKYFDKGNMIALVGRLQTRTWQTDDGQKRKATEVVCNQVSFCGSKKDSNNNNYAPNAPTQVEPVTAVEQGESPLNVDAFGELDEDDSDLPF